MNLSKILPEDHVKTAILMAIDEKKRISVASIIKGSLLLELILSSLIGILMLIAIASAIVIAKLAIIAALVVIIAIFTVALMLVFVYSTGKLTKVKEFTRGLSELNKLIYRSQHDSGMTEEAYKRSAEKFYNSTELKNLFANLYA